MMVHGVLQRWIIAGVITLAVAGVPIHAQKEARQPGGELLPIEKRIESLEQEKSTFQAKEQLKPLLQDISQRIDSVKNELQSADEERQSFLNLKLSTLTKWYQYVNELSQTRNRIINVLQEHIQILETIKEEQIRAEPKDQKAETAPGYQKLREYANKVYETDRDLSSLKNAKTNVTRERDRRQNSLKEIKQEYTKKQNQQAAINQQPETAGQALDEELKDLRIQQQAEIIDLQLEYLQYRKKSAQAKIEEDRLRIDVTETKISRTQKELDRLKQDYKKITRSLYIDSQFVEQQKEQLEKTRQEISKTQEQLNERRRTLKSKQDHIQSAIDERVAQWNISQDRIDAYKNWNIQPGSSDDWKRLAQLGSRLSEKNFIQVQSERVEGQVDQELIKLRNEELSLDILKTWYRLTQTKALENMRELEKESNKYESEKTQLEVDRTNVQDQRDNAISMLGPLNARLEALKQLEKQFQEKSNDIFDDQQAITSVSDKLQKAEADVRKQIDTTAKLVEIYSTSVATIEKSLAHIGDILSELKSRQSPGKSNQSIEPKDLLSFFDNVDRFLTDLRTKILYNITQIDPSYYINSITSTLQNTYQLIILLLQLCIVCAGYILLRRYLPRGANVLVAYESTYASINILLGFVALLMRFARRHLTTLYIWFILFAIVAYGFVTSLQFAVVFYLGSIPYGLYITYAFFEYFMRINRERGYIFISQDYQSRFLWIVPSLTYATIIITCFRQALLLSGYPDYQVLLALNFILLQISLICLVSREHVLSLVSGDTPIWKWVEEHVDQYYYILLIAMITIIVMANPFVGFGLYVLDVLIRIIPILLLIPLVSWLHDHIKRATSDLFFYYSEGEVVKERFSGGKSWYGLFVIASFFTLVMCGLVIGAYVWGYAITWDTITQWFDISLYETYDAAGNKISVTIWSLLKVLLYGVGGIVVTYIINQFVLQRIFDPLLVGAGVQNTIVTLTRYAIVVLAILFGLQSAGLEALGWKIILLLTGLAYVMREALGDVVSYFIILVQRPIKVGDYMSMEHTAGADPNISGVVRQINPRSTIVRHKNSTSFVVPNSHIITKTVKNWHYTRTFTAFDDIWITLPYRFNPDHIRDVIFHVLEENVNVLRNPRPVVRLERFTENGFQFRVRGYITADKILDMFDISSQVRLAIIRRLRDEDIAIAEPVRIMKQTYTSGDTNIVQDQHEEKTKEPHADES